MNALSLYLSLSLPLSLSLLLSFCLSLCSYLFLYSYLCLSLIPNWASLSSNAGSAYVTNVLSLSLSLVCCLCLCLWQAVSSADVTNAGQLCLRFPSEGQPE